MSKMSNYKWFGLLGIALEKIIDIFKKNKKQK